MGDFVTRAFHVIPVPRGWSVEQAWEAIRRGDLLTDPDPDWGTVVIEDGGMVAVLQMDCSDFDHDADYERRSESRG